MANKKIPVCDNCEKVLDENKVFSNRGYTPKFCSARCMAYYFLDIRVASIKQTKNMMGEQ